MSGFRFHCAKLKGCSKNAASISAMKRFAPGGTGSARGSRRRSASSAFIINHFHPGDGTSTRFSCASMANCATSGGRPVGRVVEGEVLESFVTKRRDREATLRFMRKAMKGFGRLKLVVTDRLRSTTILTRNAIFAAAKSSKSIARPCRMASNCSLKLTGGPDFLRRPHSSDAAARSLWSTGRRIPGHSVLVGQYGECYVITRLILEEKCPNIIYRAKIMASQEKTLDDFTIDGDLFKVLVNDEGQHSLWPSAQQPPKGWKEAGCSGGKSECLEFVEKNWKDMRPISLQKQMAGN